jgi:DNA-binding transcriptional MerR regulator
LDNKAPDAFRTISEVADDLDLPQHVLRFWESRFHEIKPMKRGGGRRYYRPDDIDLLRGIRHLLYGEGYTIRGVQRILREQGLHFVQEIWQPGAPQLALPPAEAGGEAIAPPTVARGAAFPGVLPREQNPTDAVIPAQPHASVPAAAWQGLAPDDMRRLTDALRELGECRKLLDAAINEQR